MDSNCPMSIIRLPDYQIIQFYEARMSPSTSSRFAAIISGVVASRFRRSSGSVFTRAEVGAGYGDRTRLTGLGSQDITTMLSPRPELQA